MSAFAGPVPESLARWRLNALQMLDRGVRPDQLHWGEDGSAAPLFGVPPDSAGMSVPNRQVPRHYRSLANSVGCHRDPARWSLLYELLWRLTHGEPHLLDVASDPLVYRLIRMHRAVRRAAHKMKAFVRFRAVRRPDCDDEEFVAWFEPAHRVVERAAPFFVERFRSMRWSILTPDGCAHWDRETLRLTGGIERHQKPRDADSLDDLWRTYYASTFNPARLNLAAMRAEMPALYWKNLPESTLIDPLTRGAAARVTAMIAQSQRDSGDDRPTR